MEISPTGRVILGMLSLGKNTGYDIKQFVDKSVRHFWAASYGQIYPELRRLEAEGLIVGHDAPSGGRARTVYALTGPGRDALEDWLREDTEAAFELRCETMLKLFFSDAIGGTGRAGYLRAFREQQERKLAQLQALEPFAREGPEGVYLSLQFGLAFSEFIIDWCRQTEVRLGSGAGKG
jgi:PadR family transcriptional regulator AphA